MSALKSKALQLSGQKLTRVEMKNILGGVEAPPDSGTNLCLITISGPNHSNPVSYTQFLDGSANTYCVNLIATAGNGINHCSYACTPFGS